MFRFMRHSLWLAINLVVVSMLLLAEASAHLDPATYPLIGVFGLMFEPLVWLNIVFAVSWFFSHRKLWCLVSFVALALSFGGILSTYSRGCYSRSTLEENGYKKLSILTYNTHLNGMVKKAPKNDVLNYIRQSDADIVCLQEYEVRKDPYYLTFQEAKNYLKDIYPYTYYDFAQYNSKRQYGLAVYSKYPLLNKQTIRYQSRANISDRCDVAVGTDTFRLFNNHLESNSIEHQDIDPLDSLSSEAIKKSAFRLFGKISKAYTFRAPQVREVRREIEQSPYPVIVAGDMNDVPVSYTYRTLSKGLRDAWLESSFGRTGHTYCNRIWGVRIDHLLVDKRFRISGCSVDHVPYSDHYPLKATLSW